MARLCGASNRYTNYSDKFSNLFFAGVASLAVQFGAGRVRRLELYKLLNSRIELCGFGDWAISRSKTYGTILLIFGFI